jgi:hypothetical protein
MVLFFPMDLVSTRPVFSSLDRVLVLSGGLAVLLMLLSVTLVALRRYQVLAPALRGGVLLASYGVATYWGLGVRWEYDQILRPSAGRGPTREPLLPAMVIEFGGAGR